MKNLKYTDKYRVQYNKRPFCLLYLSFSIHLQTSSEVTFIMTLFKSIPKEPWLVWLNGLSTSLGTKGSPVRFPVREHAWVAGQVPRVGCVRYYYTLMFLSLSFSRPSPLSKNK